jgi:putative membrane protein
MRSNSPNIVNELAKARNRAAAERTLMTWIQICVVLIGFGVALDRIFNVISQTFPQSSYRFNLRLTTVVGLGSIGFGIVLLGLAILTYLNQVRALTQTNYLGQPLSHTPIALILGAVGLFAAIVLLLIFWGLA